MPKAGRIGNVSFAAIPFNAAHKAGVKVVANALIVLLLLVLGLVHSVLAGFGHMPMLGAWAPDLKAWRALWDNQALVVRRRCR